MNKKIAKKLVLSKETLRDLSEAQLGKIAGGIGPSDPGDISCKGSCGCPPTQ
jgi:hypothetical protein